MHLVLTEDDLQTVLRTQLAYSPDSLPPVTQSGSRTADSLSYQAFGSSPSQ